MNDRVSRAMALVLPMIFMHVPCTFAHDLGLSGIAMGSYAISRSSWKLDDRTLTADVSLSRTLSDHLMATPGVDPATIQDEAREAAITARIDVRRNDEPCDGALITPGSFAADDFHVRVRYSCSAQTGAISVAMPLVSEFGKAHRHLAAVDDGAGSRTEVLQGASPAFEVKPGGGQWLPTSFLTLGIRHILGGYDHLIFLLGLILLGGTAPSLLKTVTAFTIAHSITLAVAALDIWNPGSAFVEPAIGLTIAYIGIENLFLKEPKGRWRVTFALGLVHGFGFASALADAGLAHNHIVPALLLFNLGVEIGQVLVLAALLPIVLRARKSAWVVARGVPTASIAVAAVGMTLFLWRIVS